MYYDLKKTKSLDGDGEETVLGLTNFIDGTIQVLSGVNEQVIQQTFWHEIVHAILIELGMANLNEDEGFVDAFSKQIYAVLNENNVEGIYKFLGGKVGKSNSNVHAKK